MTPTHHRDREQPIGVLIPKPLADRPRPRPAPILGLPVPRPPVDLSAVELVLGVACPDRSGRVTESAVLQVLHWGPGQPRSSPHGDHAYGSVISRRQSPQGHVPGWVADCPYAVAVAQGGLAGRLLTDGTGNCGSPRLSPWRAYCSQSSRSASTWRTDRHGGTGRSRLSDCGRTRRQ